MTLSQRRRRPAAVCAIGALALAPVLAGCASKTLSGQGTGVSSAGASSAASAAAAQDCPASPPQTLSSNVPGLDTQLEPLAATKVLLCIYPGQPESGSPDVSVTKSAITLTAPVAITALQNALNALAVPPSNPVNCPNDTGSSVLAVFTSGQQVVEVLMKTSGCPEASNGAKTGWVGASDFAAILTGLLKS